MSFTDRSHEPRLLKRESLKLAKTSVSNITGAGSTVTTRKVQNHLDYSVGEMCYASKTSVGKLVTRIPISPPILPLSTRNTSLSAAVPLVPVSQNSKPVVWIKDQEKHHASLRNLLTTDSLKCRLSNTNLTGHKTMLFSKPKISLRIKNPENLLSFLSHEFSGRWPVIRHSIPRKLALLAKSATLNPHPGDKDIPLVTNKVGLLESAPSVGEMGQLSKATLKEITEKPAANLRTPRRIARNLSLSMNRISVKHTSGSI